MILSSIAIIFAAAFNSIMDSVENEHIWDTKFAKYKDKPVFNNFIYKRESWRLARKIFEWKFDLWHTCKSAMIACMVIAIVAYRPMFEWWADFAILSLLWLIVFNLMYNKVLKS
jgi:hypothetical protein